MENFVQYAPTEVIFGKGTENQTGEEVKKWGECFWFTVAEALSAAA